MDLAKGILATLDAVSTTKAQCAGHFARTILALLVVLGCAESSDRTVQFSVLVRTALEPGVEFSWIQTDVETDGNRTFATNISANVGMDFQQGVVVMSESAFETGTYAVRVKLIDDAGKLVAF